MCRSSGRWKGPPWVPAASSPSIHSGPWWRANPPCHGPATARVKLRFPDGPATRTCQPGGAEREAGVKGALGLWSLAALAPAANPGSSPRAAGSAFCSCGVCGPGGQSSHHSRSFKCEAGAPGERAPPPCERLRPGSKPSQQKRLLFSAPSLG